MSAPNAGRQSPEPERQAGNQVNHPADGKVGSQSDESKKESQNTLDNLESNPKSVMDDAAAQKTAKGHQGA
ncbi:hypothetical protein MBLNU457_4979t1 [Dothideomycetes sp. NU457]